MNTPTTISTVFCLLLLSFSSEGVIRSENVVKFIKSSSQTVIVLMIDIEVDENFTHEQPMMKLKLQSESLRDCELRVGEDSFRNATQLLDVNKFKVSENFKDFLTHWICSSCDYVIFTSSSFLEKVLKCLINALGRFLILLVDNEKTNISDQHLMDLLNATWTSNRALKVYISIDEKIYSFDPFHRTSNGSFGKLNLNSDNFNVSGERFKNLNGYPLKVEMFNTIFGWSKMKNPKDVNDFTGPDAKIAKLIAENMNATSQTEMSFSSIFLMNFTF